MHHKSQSCTRLQNLEISTEITAVCKRTCGRSIHHTNIILPSIYRYPYRAIAWFTGIPRSKVSKRFQDSSEGVRNF